MRWKGNRLLRLGSLIATNPFPASTAIPLNAGYGSAIIRTGGISSTAGFADLFSWGAVCESALIVATNPNTKAQAPAAFLFIASLRGRIPACNTNTSHSIRCRSYKLRGLPYLEPRHLASPFRLRVL